VIQRQSGFWTILFLLNCVVGNPIKRPKAFLMNKACNCSQTFLLASPLRPFRLTENHFGHVFTYCNLLDGSGDSDGC